MPTRNLTIGFSRANGTVVGSQSGVKRFYGSTFARLPIASFRHTYSTLLRSVGTEFKVMQELLRHSSLRSTLDIYTQAISPAKHEAQAAVLSLVFSSEIPPPSSTTTKEDAATT